MEPIYKYSESTIEPLLIEVGVNCVYLRKDVAKQIRTDSMGNKVTYWTYKEAVMTSDEFNRYSTHLASINAVKGVNDSANILRILTDQVAGGDNQMAIMEAIADLYDAVASLM